MPSAREGPPPRFRSTSLTGGGVHTISPEGLRWSSGVYVRACQSVSLALFRAVATLSPTPWHAPAYPQPTRMQNGTWRRSRIEVRRDTGKLANRSRHAPVLAAAHPGGPSRHAHAGDIALTLRPMRRPAYSPRPRPHEPCSFALTVPVKWLRGQTPTLHGTRDSPTALGARCGLHPWFRPVGQRPAVHPIGLDPMELPRLACATGGLHPARSIDHRFHWPVDW